MVLAPGALSSSLGMSQEHLTTGFSSHSWEFPLLFHKHSSD